MMKGNWEVQEYCLCGGWTNTWAYEEDGKRYPTRFASVEEAEKGLEEYIQDIKEEYEAGNLYDELEIDNFRIVEVEDEASIV